MEWRNRNVLNIVGMIINNEHKLYRDFDRLFQPEIHFNTARVNDACNLSPWASPYIETPLAHYVSCHCCGYGNQYY